MKITIDRITHLSTPLRGPRRCSRDLPNWDPFYSGRPTSAFVPAFEGVLSLTIGKRAEAKPRKIEIKR